jgi:hypothetical protein
MSSSFGFDFDLSDAQGQADNVGNELVTEVDGHLNVRHPNGLRNQNIFAESGTYRELLHLSDLLSVELVLLDKHAVGGDQGVFAVSLVDCDKRCEVSGLLEQPHHSDKSFVDDDVVASFSLVALLGLLAELRTILMECLRRDLSR